MNVLIVDDEPLARRRLRKLLSGVAGVNVIGEAEHGEAALALVNEEPPDLVLLDIDMPGAGGLALAERLPEQTAVVFTTAHSEHALAAFRLAAIDYLLKPIDEQLLREALERVRTRRRFATNQADDAPCAEPARPPDLIRIAARAGGTVELIDPARVRRFFASDKYTLCVLDGREYVLDQTLRQLEERLRPHGFMRVHRRELVNVACVKALRPLGSAAELELDDGHRVEVSRRSLADLKQRLGLR